MMAKIQIKMPEDFLLKLSKLGERTDEIIPKVLAAGGEVVLAKARGNLKAAVGCGTKAKSRSTGELVRSLGLSKARQKRDGSGWDIKIGFAEPRSGGSSNAKIANILEYGKHGQPAKPFLKPARRQSKDAAIEAMKAKLEQEAWGR
jgi:HK97 gp10 family phage protein